MSKWSTWCLVFLLVLHGRHSLVGGRAATLPTKTSTTTTTRPSVVSPPSLVPTKCDPCPTGVRCVPPIQCPAVVHMSPAERPQLCDLPTGMHGYCCTTGQKHVPDAGHHHRHNTVSRNRHHGDSNNDINDHHHHHIAAHTDGEEMAHIVSQARREFEHHNKNVSAKHANVLRAVASTDRAVERVLAARLLQQRHHIPASAFQLDRVPGGASLLGTAFEGDCAPRVHCAPAARHRSADGTCNNPLHSSWGSAGAPMGRLLAPAYEDGIWAPRAIATDGGPLPNARTVSRELFQDADRPHGVYNLLLMQFGQFVTHDITHSTAITQPDGAAISCCAADGAALLPPDQLHMACMPIAVEGEDALYTPFGQRCLNVVRSAIGTDADAACRLGHAQQLSSVSHYIDGSAIYGPDERTQRELREFSGGALLAKAAHSAAAHMPQTNEARVCGAERPPCFLTGDDRANQIVSLMAVHELFVREHNRLARRLVGLNPHWSDEEVFQVARSIVIAQLQHIVYAEWLPYVIGSETMERFRLNVLNEAGWREYSREYDANINAAVTSEFTTAAFRFGHSTVDGKYIVKKGDHVVQITPITHMMFESSRLQQPQFFDDMLNTLTAQPMQQVDSAITYGLAGLLFQGQKPFGQDLAAINVQRGRDHGIRPYNDYLQATGRPRLYDFEQFGATNAERLRCVYAHPDDIDLWVGGLQEDAHGDGLLGPTFADIVADQFSRLRRGDRYFYDLGPQDSPAALTPDQLNEVRSSGGVTMARILCDNTDRQSAAPHAFMRSDVAGNEPIACDLMPQLNLEPWRQPVG